MTRSRSSQGAVVLSLAFLAAAPAAAERAGNLVGWVEDTQGAPVSGAVISIFGKGIGGAGLVTLSDSAGRFFLPALPPGSYTLRALGTGHLPAPARQITVLPDQDSIFSVSLTPISSLTDKETEERTRELRWLLRHKRRSVLESEAPLVVAARHDTPPAASDLLDLSHPRVADLAGTVEVVANPAAFGVDADALADDSLPSSRSLIRLQGRFAENGRWSLGGLVSESENAAWRMAAEFVVEPGGGHEIQAGAGYGSQTLRPAAPGLSDGRDDGRGVGALFVQDRWGIGAVSATVGARYCFVGYLREANHLDPTGSVEVRSGDGATIRGTFVTRTLLPGGDLFTLSSLASGPALALAVLDQDLRPERLVRYELAVDRKLGPSTLGAHTFYEGVRSQLVSSYEGPLSGRSLHIFNARGLAARGMGVTLGRRFGGALKGSVTYTYGRSWRLAPAPIQNDLGLPEGAFHDVVARIETAIDRSGTRVVAFYRINTLAPEAEGSASLTSSRFDLQLRQGLPFLGDLTRADWELLLAYRNLFYEADEGGTLDELAAQNPPKRMLGGISVRF